MREGKSRYRRFVEEGLLREIEDPGKAARWQAVLGSEDFLQTMRDKMQAAREQRREVKALRRGTRGTDPLAIIGLVAAEHDLPIQRLLQGRACGLQARSMAMWTVWHCDLSLREIGSIFSRMDYAAVAQRIRRIDRDATLQKRLRNLVEKCQNI